jgi:hypothetical protein
MVQQGTAAKLKNTAVKIPPDKAASGFYAVLCELR